jgi:hypothetical protein
MNRPNLNDAIFWEMDTGNIDWEQHAPSIIIRVLERGNLDDFKEIRRFYGDEKIKKVAQGSRYLSAQLLSFLSFFYDLPKTSFECYKNKQYQLPHLTF